MLSQEQIAKDWGEGCFHGPKLAITLYGGGVVTVRPAIGDAVLALDAVLRSFRYQAFANDTGGYNCRPKTGSTETSNHGRAIAIDIDWNQNPYGAVLHTNMPRAMVDDICAIRTNNGQQVWNWGGNWSGNKDAMHFEIVCKPSDIATGIKGGSVPTPFPEPDPNPPPVPPITPSGDIDKETETMQFINATGRGNIGLFVVGDQLHEIPLTGDSLAKYSALGVPSSSLTPSEMNDLRGAYGVPAV